MQCLDNCCRKSDSIACLAARAGAAVAFGILRQKSPNLRRIFRNLRRIFRDLTLGESRLDVKCKPFMQKGKSVPTRTVLPPISQRQNGSALQASSCSMAGIFTTLD